MQTFDIRPPAFRSARNDEPNLSSEQPPQSANDFGALMNRALSGKNPRDVNRDDGESRQETSAPDRSAESQSQHNRSKAASKTANRSDTSDATATAPQTGLQSACAAAPYSPPKAQSDSDNDEGTSENASDSDKGKKTTTAGDSNKTAKSDGTALTTGAGLLGVPSPAPTPVPATGRSAKETKGNSTGAANTDKHSEPADATTNSDTKSVAVKDSADTDAGEKILTASDAPAKDALETAPHADKAVSATTLAALPDPAGTSAAKQYTTMKNLDKTPKIAEAAEQDLPGKAIAGSEELPLVPKSVLHGSEKHDSTFTVDSSAATRISPEPTISVAPQAVSIATDIDSRLRVLERTHDIVALHAMRLTQTASDTLHVVVKPGDGIQLSLELRQGDGFVEVNASLHKGDFNHLSQYWPELQQRLDARGVRVGDLSRSENFSDTSSQQFQQSKQQQSPDQDPMHAGAFAEFALAGSLREAPATRAARVTAYRGWESWA